MKLKLVGNRPVRQERRTLSTRYIINTLKQPTREFFLDKIKCGKISSLNNLTNTTDDWVAVQRSQFANFFRNISDLFHTVRENNDDAQIPSTKMRLKTDLIKQHATFRREYNYLIFLKKKLNKRNER